jgi:hypothetical protein
VAFPQEGEVSLSTGSCTKAYHVYDGHGALVTGHCDASALEWAFAGQDVYPVTTRSGAGVLGLFICRFDRASLGPHLELQVVALAAPIPNQRVSDDPTAFLAAFATRPDWGPLSLHLWNDSPTVVAYNTEYLGLEAQRATGQVTLDGGQLRFDFHDTAGDALVQGRITRKRRSDFAAGVGLIRQLGLRAMIDMVRQPLSKAHLINRKSSVLPRNARACTMTAPDNVVVSAFRPGRDVLTMASPDLRRYNFRPLCAEHISPFRFVYLHPDDPRGRS